MDKPRLTEFERLERGLLIDQDDLDQVLIRQPQLFYEVGKQVANLTSQRDAWKQQLQEEEAKADARIRYELSQTDDKPREGDIKGQVLLSREVMTTNKLLMDCNKALGQWSALKEAYVHRVKVLKDLTNLYTTSYFADSSVGYSSRSVRNSDAERARQSMAEQRKLNARRS
jgi:hypothetical protein